MIQARTSFTRTGEAPTPNLDIAALSDNLSTRLSEILPEMIPGSYLNTDVITTITKVVINAVAAYMNTVLPDKIKSMFDDLSANSESPTISTLQKKVSTQETNLVGMGERLDDLDRIIKAR